MPFFTSKPSRIEAEQFQPDKLPLPFHNDGACCYDGKRWFVVTAHGQKTQIVEGDWIVREPDGRGFYPVKPDIFEKRWAAECVEQPAGKPEIKELYGPSATVSQSPIRQGVPALPQEDEGGVRNDRCEVGAKGSGEDSGGTGEVRRAGLRARR